MIIDVQEAALAAEATPVMRDASAAESPDTSRGTAPKAAEGASGDPLLRTEAETETILGEMRGDTHTLGALTTRERGPTAAETETTPPIQRDDGCQDDALDTQTVQPASSREIERFKLMKFKHSSHKLSRSHIVY